MGNARKEGLASGLASVAHNTSADLDRLEQIKRFAEEDIDTAKQHAWIWLRELQNPRESQRLDWLFAQGYTPESPDGDCEGIVMSLGGAPWLVLLDRLVRLGQLLGGIGWTGKSFNREAGTGFNRLTTTSRIPAFLCMPNYKFKTVNGELTGFHFYHTVETSPLAPKIDVRTIKYDAPEHANPLVLPRTRDELVELVPGIYLGRAMLNKRGEWKVVGYFGLRFPVGG